MAAAFRRVVLKPPDITDKQLAKLRANLEKAVDQQIALAVRSRHVVNFTGRLAETDSCFTVEHEPGRALSTQSLFDGGAACLDPDDLLAITAALMDALRAGYTTNGKPPLVHGGICGGTLLQTVNGMWQVSDFGFAPAICDALGQERYLELAVAGDVESEAPRHGTAVWEILSAEDETRDDRICGFVDPHKYAAKSLATFEPRSDIASSGILLHLLAEHNHPLLPGDDEHRLSVVAESMAWQAYLGPRRPELANSPNRAVRRWCEIVERMLSRSPDARPNAQEVIEALKDVEIEPVAVPGVTHAEADPIAETGKPTERKRGIALALTAVVVLASLAAVWFYTGREAQPITPTVITKATDAAPAPPTRRPTAPALQTVREILGTSRFLSVETLQTLVTTQDDGSAGDLQVHYLIPGLATSPATVTVAEPAPGDPWFLSDASREKLAADAAALDALLGSGTESNLTDWAQETFSVSSAADFATPERLTAKLPTPPDWQRHETTWVASAVELTITLQPESADTAPLDVLDIAVDLTADEGQVRATLSGSSAALDAKLNESVRRVVIAQQARSQEAHLARLAAAVPDVALQFTVDDRSTRGPLPDLPITIRATGLATRGILLTWNASSLVFDTDPAEETVLAGIGLAWHRLSSLNEAVRGNPAHWLHDAYTNGFRGSITETSPPVGGRWRLSVPPPWAPNADPDHPDDAADRLPLDANVEPLELIRPPYWSVIATYAKLTRQPLFVSEPDRLAEFAVDVRASGESEVQPLLRFLGTNTPPKHLYPSFELATPAPDGSRSSVRPVFRVPENLIGGSLTVPVHGRFAVKRVEESRANSVVNLNVDKIDRSVRALFDRPSPSDIDPAGRSTGLPSAMLTFSADSAKPDGVVVHFSELAEVVRAMTTNLGRVTALDTHLATFASRAKLERALDAALTQTAGQLGDTEAYAFLKKIWRVKALQTAAPSEGELAAFAKTRQRKFRTHMTKRRLMPTVLVEYFTGPRSVYAIVFSVSPTRSDAALPEGAWLVKVCAIDDLSGGTALGDTLLRPVLGKVPIAIGSAFSSPFAGRLGIVLAVDAMLSPDALPELRMSTPLRSYLEPSGELTTDARNVDWSSLAELRQGDQMGDFTLVETLAASKKAATTSKAEDLPSLRWVWTTLFGALDAP